MSLSRWVRATWLGWLLGIPLIVVLALLAEGVGVGGAQVCVGAGMGLGVGFMQRRALDGAGQGSSVSSCTRTCRRP